MRYLLLTWWLLAPITVSGATDLSALKFLDQNGKTKTVADFSKDYCVLTFLFTRCPSPEMCPLAMTLTQKTHRLLKKEIPTVQFKVLVATIDPNFDTPPVLKKYAAARKVDTREFTFLTGDEPTMSTFGSAFNVVGFPSSVGFYSHNLKTILLGPGFKVIAQFRDNEWKAEDLVSAAKTAVSEKTNSPQP